MYKIIQKRTIWLSISGALVAASILAVSLWGLKLGIDFTGGSLLEVKFLGQAPNITTVQDGLSSIKLDSLTLQPTDNNGMVLRFQQSDNDTHVAVAKKLNELAGGTDKELKIEELRFEAVGPTIGKELQGTAIWATILCIFFISLYIAFAFRKVSKPVASWKYGAATIVALFHDVFIVIGAFAILGKFFNIEVNTQFVAAVLTVLGFSVHDTIVVFDRIRENLPKSDLNFEGTVNYSINQTLVRSINTSVTVLLVLLAITLFGGLSIKFFALALLIGIFFGTYSSIFLASPLLVVWENWKRKGQRA